MHLRVAIILFLLLGGKLSVLAQTNGVPPAKTNHVSSIKTKETKKEEPAEPAWEGQVKLTGLSGTQGQRLAMLNGKTFAQGEKGEVKAKGKVIQIHCLEIRENSVVVEVEGFKKPIEIIYSGK